jgi:hypothetical protein
MYYKVSFKSMAQKRTSRKKKQRVLKKKEEKKVGGVDQKPITVMDDDYGLREEEEKEANNNAFSEYSNSEPDARPFTQEQANAEMDIRTNRKIDNPPPKSITDKIKNAAKNIFKPEQPENVVQKKPEEKKKKGKTGNFEKKFAKVGEKLDKIAFDLDFDSLKSSNKAPIIKQTLVESISNKSKIVNDGVQEKMNTETGYKNANPMDVIWVETIRQIEDMFATYQRAASGIKDKDQGTKTTTVIETEVFPAQKEKIHTTLLKFLYDMILVPENDETFKKIVWSFIAKINEKDLIKKDVPSGFKEIQEIKYVGTNAGVQNNDLSNGPSNGPVNGGSKRKKQRGGTLQLNGTTVQFDGIEKETLFYSILDNDAVISTTNDFLEDVLKMDNPTYPFSLLFFDLETIEEDWLQKPESVDILLGLLKETEKGILIADPELEFKGTGENKMVLRATFNLENGVYGVFVHHSVTELDTVLNLLDGMELVEKTEKEEKEEREVVAPALNTVISSPTVTPTGSPTVTPTGSPTVTPLGSPRSPPGSPPPVSINTNPTVDASKITDAILKTAIRLVADSLRKKATLIGTTQDKPETQNQNKPELRNTSVFVPLDEDQQNTLTKYDRTIVPLIENNKQEINITNNYVKNNTNIFNIIESENSPPDDTLQQDIKVLKQQNANISQDVAVLSALIETFMNSQIIHTITDQSQIQAANEIQTTDSVTQTPLVNDEIQNELETFKQKSREQTTALEQKVQELQKAVQDKIVQSTVTNKEITQLLEENQTLSSELESLKKEKESKTVVNSDSQTDGNGTLKIQDVSEKLTKDNLAKLAKEQELANLAKEQEKGTEQEQKVPILSIPLNKKTKPIVPFKISETGLRVGGLKTGSHLFKDDAVHIGWDYIKGIREKYANYKEPKMYKKIISPAIISERVTMCQNLLNILDNLTDIKKIEERKKHKKNVSEIYLEHASIIAYILNYQNFNKLPIKTITSKNNEIQKYKDFTKDNLLYYLYKKQEIQEDFNITIKDLKDTTNILDFFEKVRSYLYQELKKIDDSLSTDTNYFDTSEKGKKKKSNTTKYDVLLKEIHDIIQKKQQNLKDLEDKNNENVKLINTIPHKDRNKGGEKIDIHMDTPDLENYINQSFLMKSGQMDPEVKESPKELLKRNYGMAIVPTNLKILDTIDTTIKLNTKGIVDYEAIDFIDLIDIKKETTVEIPIPKNKKNKTEKNTKRPNTGRQSRRSLSEISDGSKAESEDDATREIYSIKPISIEVSENVKSILNILDKISKEDIQPDLFKNPSNSEINSNSSSRRSSNTGSFVTANGNNNNAKTGRSDDSFNSDNSSSTINEAKSIDSSNGPSINGTPRSNYDQST